MGAIVSVCFIGFFALLGIFIDTLMSCGMSGSEFWGKFAQGAKNYVPIGMVIGGVTGSWFSAWMAVPVMIATFIALMFIQGALNKRRR